MSHQEIDIDERNFAHCLGSMPPTWQRAPRTGELAFADGQRAPRRVKGLRERAHGSPVTGHLRTWAGGRLQVSRSRRATDGTRLGYSSFDIRLHDGRFRAWYGWPEPGGPAAREALKFGW